MTNDDRIPKPEIRVSAAREKAGAGPGIPAGVVEKETRDALQRYLPAELPERARLIELSARHVALLAEVNRSINLTAITSPLETAIKHVLDSVIPAPALGEARTVLDVGSGAGFPGIPLAIVCPERRFVLSESVQKKARFLDRAVTELGLENVEIYPGRAEAWLASARVDVVVVRAVGSTGKLLALLGPASSRVSELLFYKGPAGEEELSDANASMSRFGLRGEVALRYQLPEGMGRRCVLRLTRVSHRGGTPDSRTRDVR